MSAGASHSGGTAVDGAIDAIAFSSRSSVSGRAGLAYSSLLGLYAVFVIVAFTDIFDRAGLVTVAFALLYAGGVCVLALELPRLTKLPPGTIVLALLLPTVALLSVLWSVEPASSLRHALQFLFTGLIAVWMGARFDQRAVLWVLAAGTGVCIFASLANLVAGAMPSYAQDDYVGAPAFFVGLHTHKNTAGHVIALCAFALASLCMIRGRALGGLVAALLFLPLMLRTGSTTALIIYGMTLTMPFAWWSLRTVGSLPVLMLLLVAIGGSVQIAGLALSIAPADVLAQLTGKDASLTGRTEVWSLAAEQFTAAPVFGIGYQAFWTAGAFSAEVDAVGAAVLESIDNFHNAFIEIAIGTGLLGLAALTIAMGTGLWFGVRELAQRPSAATLVSVYLLLLLAVRSLVEATLAFQHTIDSLLLAIVLVQLGRAHVPITTPGSTSRRRLTGGPSEREQGSRGA